MRIAFFGSSLVSAYWNGACTYYRGLLKEMARRGHIITFYEPDAYDRQKHRDIPDPEWAQVVVYPATSDGWQAALESGARDADLLVKASGVGVFDDELERALPHASSRAIRAYWDVDAPATLEAMAADGEHPLHEAVGSYDVVFTYGGGDPVVRGYHAVGARLCVPIYNAVDPDMHHPVPPNPAFACDLSFLGNRLPDRERRVEEYFLEAAALLPGRTFLLGGSGWHDKPMSPNIRHLGHVGTADHNAFFCSGRTTLNVNRDSMARFGFSPPTRVFEAAGAGACLMNGSASNSFSIPARKCWWRPTVKPWPRTSPHCPKPLRAASARRRAVACSTSTPMRTACGRLMRFSTPWQARRRRRNDHEYRRLRTVDHVVLGQWPRHHLSRPDQGARRARSPSDLRRA
jgi:spore maturation protein CgeB